MQGVVNVHLIARGITRLRFASPCASPRSVHARLSRCCKMESEEHRDKRPKTEASSAPQATQQTAAAAPPSAGGGGKKRPHVKQQKQAATPPVPVLPPSLPQDQSHWDNAVLLIDKPLTWTSFDVCGKLRGQLAGLLRRKAMSIKVGHAGTLDPAATGLLIVCVGRGTKSIDSFVAMRKEYSGVMRLGEATPSFDADTEVSERLPWEHITDEAVMAARDKFLGAIEQLPPMFSAVRLGGKRLYEAARAGKEVEGRKARPVHIERFDLLRDPGNPQDLRFDIVCSKGTYIRSLAHDLGRALGSAAHVTALRREAIGELRVDGAWSMENLTTALQKQRDGAAGAVRGGASKARAAAVAEVAGDDGGEVAANGGEAEAAAAGAAEAAADTKNLSS